MDKPDVFNLSRIEWSLFVTLTWAREHVPQSVQRKYWFAILRKVAKWSGVHFERVLWILRTEFGEIGHRAHWHSVIGGLPPHILTEGLCYAMQETWEHFEPLVWRRGTRLIVGVPTLTWEHLSRNCGSARCRIYNPELNGLDYSSPDSEGWQALSDSSVKGANRYEAMKFGQAAAVEYSLSLIRKFSGRRWRHGRFERCPVQSRQSGVGVLSPKSSRVDISGSTSPESTEAAITLQDLANHETAKTGAIRPCKLSWSEDLTGVFHVLHDV